MLTITFESIAPDGVVYRAEEKYRPEGDEGPRRTYWSGNFGMSGYASDQAFRDRRMAALREMAEGAYKSRCAERERAALVARFDAECEPRLQDVLKGLAASEDIRACLRTAVEWHSALESLKNVLGQGKNTARQQLVAVYREARSNARDEYPEDYRDAEDKDDFYNDYRDDIAQYMAGGLM